MTVHCFTASCQPDPDAELARSSGWLPPGLRPALPVARQAGSAQTACSVLDWATSGLMDLTGPEAGPPLAPAAPVLTRVRLVADLIGELARRRGSQLRLDPAQLLTSRARELGLRRHGTVSANLSCAVMRAADGWLAVNLARPADVASLPAALGRALEDGSDPVGELRAAAATRPAASLAADLQLVGVPAAVLGSAGDDTPAVAFRRVGKPAAGLAEGLVLDLSAMWAGPLCASILRQAGWRVVRVEDARRRDGARAGPQRFYANLHAGIPAVLLDFSSAAGQQELFRLASAALVIIDSSRPRALRRLGLVAEDWLAAGAGRIWLSVTGYGRDDPQQRVAFGDDAAVAGGLVAVGPDGSPAFCGDAIADPLTGLYAGLGALAAAEAGGGMLVAAAMAGVCADVMRPALGVIPHLTSRVGDEWAVSHGEHRVRIRRR